MRYVKFDPDHNRKIMDKQVGSLAEIGSLLANATYGDWFEGIGQPSCGFDLTVLHRVGRFIEKVANAVRAIDA